MGMPEVRPCAETDLPAIAAIINDAARAYRGVIPAELWHEPYMPIDTLSRDLAEGVSFHGCGFDRTLIGVMGLQSRGELHLIRHAYVRTVDQRRGIGSMLLEHMHGLAAGPTLVGTWAAANWAIAFYRRHGYRMIEGPASGRLLRRYSNVCREHREASVVLGRGRLAGDHATRKETAQCDTP
jgi:N-acetylglutamate synthase-like GNAT family acetyltransferase